MTRLLVLILSIGLIACQQQSGTVAESPEAVIMDGAIVSGSLEAFAAQ